MRREWRREREGEEREEEGMKGERIERGGGSE